jgi:hypothetical protein
MEKMLIDIQGGCNGAVDGPAALADEGQAKGYPKSDTVANRRWVLLVRGECGPTTLNVIDRTGQRRRLPRRQAFAIWALHAAGALPMAKPSPVHTKP